MNNNAADKIKKILLNKEFLIYLIILILFYLPPVYLLPIRNILFTSHTLANFLLISQFAFFLIKGMFNYNFKKPPFGLILIYFVAQSASIIPAINVIEFIKIYKNIILSLIFFILSLQILNTNKKIKLTISVLVFLIVGGVIVQLVIYFKIFPIYTLLSMISYDSYWHNIILEETISKLPIQFYNEALIPIIFYYTSYMDKNLLTKIFYSLISGLIFFIAIISNYRINLLVTVFCFILSLIVLRAIKKPKNLFLLVVLIFILGYLARSISIYNFGYSSIERFLLQKPEDTSTIESRFSLWANAAYLGCTHALFGVGIGNVFDNTTQKKPNYSFFKEANELSIEASKYPHNVFFATFVETGFFGLFTILALFFIFMKKDILLNKSNNNLAKFASISFWGLFIFSLTGPRVTSPYLLYFWFLRAIVIKSNDLKQ